MVAVLVAAVLILLLVYLWLTKDLSYWQTKGVPFDPPFSFFGSFYDVATGRQHLCHKIGALYSKFDGPYAGFYSFTQPALLVRSPDLIKRILVKDFDKFQDRKGLGPGNDDNDPIMAHSLFGVKGDTWRAVRTKISPVFTLGKIKMMVPLMEDCVRNFSDVLSENEGKIVDVASLTKRYAIDVICSCAFGFNACTLKDEKSEMLQMTTKLLDFSSFKRKLSSMTFFFAPKVAALLKLKFTDSEATSYLTRVLRQALKTREEHNVVRNDLIDMLSTMKNDTIKDDYKFDDVKMAAHAITFFSAGNDSTANVVAFSLYEMALNPTIQDRLRLEISTVTNDQFTYDSLPSMKYLDMVLCESLRKYPFISFVNREATSDYVVEETGLKIDRNTNIMIAISGLHFDPLYFPDPHKFDPDRFSDENKANITPYTYIPFGEGPRNCIGKRFGLVAAKVALVHLIKNFIFKVDSTTSVPLDFDRDSVFLKTNERGIPLRAYKI